MKLQSSKAGKGQRIKLEKTLTLWMGAGARLSFEPPFPKTADCQGSYQGTTSASPFPNVHIPLSVLHDASPRASMVQISEPGLSHPPFDCWGNRLISSCFLTGLEGTIEPKAAYRIVSCKSTHLAMCGGSYRESQYSGDEDRKSRSLKLASTAWDSFQDKTKQTNKTHTN